IAFVSLSCELSGSGQSESGIGLATARAMPPTTVELKTRSGTSAALLELCAERSSQTPRSVGERPLQLRSKLFSRTADRSEARQRWPGGARPCPPVPGWSPIMWFGRSWKRPHPIVGEAKSPPSLLCTQPFGRPPSASSSREYAYVPTAPPETLLM